MKKVSKIIVLLITFAVVACMSTSVFAEDEPLDLTESLTGGNNSTQTEGNTDVDTNTNTGADANENTNENTNTNTSTYEESDIPYAGPADTIFMVSAFAVFGIIGIYTFIKLSEYSNI